METEIDIYHFPTSKIDEFNKRFTSIPGKIRISIRNTYGYWNLITIQCRNHDNSMIASILKYCKEIHSIDKITEKIISKYQFRPYTLKEIKT